MKRPSSHENTLDEGGLPLLNVNFADEFAPSFFEYSSADGRSIEGPVMRHFVYNTQIKNTLYYAIEHACLLGFPSAGLYPGDRLELVTSETFRQVTKIAQQICPRISEGSPEWLAVQCYLRWVTACWHWTENRETIHIMSEFLSLGAACRELELLLINKKPANARRKQIKAFAHENEGRDLANAERRKKAELWRAIARKIAIKTTLSGRARAKWVGARLRSQHEIDMADSTIFSALKGY